MHDININVLGSGILVHESQTIRLGTVNEKRRARLFFFFDDDIEGTFRYVKFRHQKGTYLKRCDSDDSLLVPSEVLNKSGKWQISVISSDSIISNDEISGNYAYISEPYDACVVDGILGVSDLTYEQIYLRDIIESNRTQFVIPTSVRRIGDYFLYDYPKNVDVVIGTSVTEIGDHAFYITKINSLKFESGSILNKLCDYAFYRCTLLKEVEIPSSVINYGKYAFASSSVTKLTFEVGSQIRVFPTYAFNKMQITELVIPYGVTGFDSTGQVISENDKLKILKLPKSFSINVGANHIKTNAILDDIVLENNWNVSANLTNVSLTASSIKKMFQALKNLVGSGAKSLTLGSSNLAKVEPSDIAVATNKNWTVS